MTDGSALRERQVRIGGADLRVLEAGDPGGPPIVFLHGWPETADAWREVMRRAAVDGWYAVAMDLPGIGGSTGDPIDGSTRAIATVVHELVTGLGLTDVVLVGHDLGGMTVYAYLRTQPGVRRAVIMNTVIPGVPPWSKVLANPYVWHFAFHSIPELPEALVTGREREYFEFFFNALSPEQSGVSGEARTRYAAAYASPGSLRTGFSWYRKLPQDATDNAADTAAVSTPVLYLRGDHEGGDLDDYLGGFAEFGLTVRPGIVEGAGHFAAEDNPEAVWRLIADFCADVP